MAINRHPENPSLDVVTAQFGALPSMSSGVMEEEIGLGQAQALSLSAGLGSLEKRVSSMAVKGFDLTALAGKDGKLVAAFTRSPACDELSLVEIPSADPGISHSYRLSASTLKHVAHNGLSWFFAYAPKTHFTSQYVIRCQTLERLLAQIRNYWKRDCRITSLAYGNNHWVAVVTYGSENKEQSFFTAADAIVLQEKTKAAWDEGRRITSITYGDGKWLVILDRETEIAAQKWLTKKSFVDLRNKIREEWLRGYQIGALTRGAGVWLVVLNRSSID